MAETELPAISVDAHKQPQRLEDVPASVSVIDGYELEADGVDDLSTLSRRVPGFGFQPSGQSGLNPPVMRGLSADPMAFSASTLLLVDGVPTLMGQGFADSLVGVERVEVLRGPQSTLYGRNAEAGVVSIHTRQPDELPNATVSAEAGSRKRRSLRFFLDGPIVGDTLYASASGAWLKQDGFIDNDYRSATEDDLERRHGRLALRWTPTRRTEVTARYAHQSFDDGGSRWGAVDTPRLTVRSGTPSWNRSSGETVSLDIASRLSERWRLRSITARNAFHDRVQQDTDFMPGNRTHIARDYRLRNLSQELRLEGSLGSTRGVAGVYGDRQRNDLHFVQKLPMGRTITDADVDTSAAALFSHWSIPVTDRWTLATGARLERNEVTLTPTGDDDRSADWTRVSPKVALQYALSTEARAYVSVSEGYRAGGFNAFAPAVEFAGYDPETVRSYELGVRGRAMDGRLRYAAAAYTMDVRAMQVQQMAAPGQVFITNAASARSTGAELEANYLAGSGWRIRAALSANRTRFRHFRVGNDDFAGNRNPFAPTLTGHFGIRYDAPRGWYARATLSGSSETYLDAANENRRDGYVLLDLAGGYVGDRFDLTAYVRNATDREYDAVGYLNGMATIYSPPREVGLRVTYDF